MHPHTGKVGPVERAVNPPTGTLGMQLLFPNPDYVLRPGQYGRARVLLDTKAGALLVPQRAVQELQNLYSVAVVGADKQGGVPQRQGRPARRLALGDRGGAQAGRAGRRRGAAARSSDGMTVRDQADGRRREPRARPAAAGEAK